MTTLRASLVLCGLMVTALGCDTPHHPPLTVENKLTDVCLTARAYQDRQTAAAEPWNTVFGPRSGCGAELTFDAPLGSQYLMIHARYPTRDVLVLEQDIEITASSRVVVDPPLLSLSIQGSGTVYGEGFDEYRGTYCTGPGSCQTPSPAGTTETLVALADPGAVFLRWASACTGASPTCVVELNVSKEAFAIFASEEGVCESDEGCDGDARCDTGYCVVPQCENDDGCEQGRRCVEGLCMGATVSDECEDDEGCDGDERCIDGQCLPEGRCSRNEHCEPGESCDGGQCVTATAECTGEEGCSSDEQCIDGSCRRNIPTCGVTPDCGDESLMCMLGHCLQPCGGTFGECGGEQICAMGCLDLCSGDRQCPVSFACNAEGFCTPQ